MSLMSKLPREFERILHDMHQDFGQKKSTTGLRAPADSGRPTESASVIRSCAGVTVIALLLTFAFAMTWLILAHV